MSQISALIYGIGEKEKYLLLGYGHKGRKKRSARSGGVVRKQVATVGKILALADTSNPD